MAGAPRDPGPPPAPGSLLERWHSGRRRVYEIIEVGRGEDTASRVVDGTLVVLILLNVIAFTLETVPSIEAAYAAELRLFEAFSVGVFTIEYVLRIWTAVEMPFLQRLPAWKARLHYATRPYLLIDLLAILPYYLSHFVPIDLRLLRALRLFRLLKLARYSPALHTLVRVFYNERKVLTGALLLVGIALLFAATGIYYIERHANPESFGSIPQAAWWAMATLTTVGYGDVYPVTPLGRLFGSFVMLMGLTIVALPIAIISAGFAREMARRDFVVTWSLVARVPILAELDAAEVASLLGHLHAHNYPAHWEVIHEGAGGDAMYFIASGKVGFTTPAGQVALERGDFFGEVALIEHSKNEHAYATLTNCRLLKLDREDFILISHTHPAIAEQIRNVALARRAARRDGRPDPSALDIRTAGPSRAV
ncbi:MAG: cyclic nucleotide-gated ion channel [Hyphomicrobiaceae bacterium]|nr:cyclic nucleotide-gated ion channel [Hyphomicrobiaceae bacterium]